MNNTAINFERARLVPNGGLANAAEIACETLLLMLPALWNRFPLLQYDTGGYLARWYEGYLVPSRPAPYGLFLNIGSFFDFWPSIFVQSLLCAWIVSLSMRTHGLHDRPRTRLSIFVGLAAATTLPWIASTLLTDIFAGLGVIALYLVVFKHSEISRTQNAGLLIVAAFAAATHSAALLLIAALAIAAVVVSLMAPHIINRSMAARPLAALIVGIAILFAGNFVVTKRIAWTPGGYGIVFGRMLEDGIVGKFLAEHCPDARFRLCIHRHELPKTADEFLWGGELFTNLGRFNGLGHEMKTIVLESAAAYPALQITTALSAAARQLVKVGSGEGVLDSIWHSYGMIEKFTPWILPAMRAARQQHGELPPFATLNMVHIPLVLGSIVVVFALTLRGLARRRFNDAETFTLIVAFVLLANAATLGPLSNPHDRYGARIAWLAPLAIALCVARWRSQKKTPAGGNRRAC